jgi:hypothetical protein
MRRFWLYSAAAAGAGIAGSASLAQATGSPASVAALRGTADVLNTLMLGGLMGLFGQGIRTIAGFRSSLDKASTQDATQDDIFRAARIVVSLFVGFLAGIAGTFVIGIREVAAANGDIQLLLGLAAAGYAGTDFLEGFFGQYFKGVKAPALGGATGLSDPAGAAGEIGSVREDLAEIRDVLLFSPALAHAGSPQEVFRAKAPGIMQQLIDDFGFTDVQAAGILGNIGHECLGFTQMQELRPVGGGRGGFGWCQWTGPRRRAFEAFAREHELDLKSDEANYNFLRHELKTSERATVPAVKAAATLEAAVRAFQVKFERPGVPHPAPRLIWARRALEAFGG